MDKQKEQLQFNVVGISFCKEVASEFLEYYNNGEKMFVNFEIDENNKFDKNAIKVMLSLDEKSYHQIGFISKDVNELVKMAIKDNSLGVPEIFWFGKIQNNIGAKVIVELTLD